MLDFGRAASNFSGLGLCQGHQSVPAASHAAHFDCGLNAQPQPHYQPGLVNSMSAIDSFSSPVGMYVPQTVKDRLWKGEFIELADPLAHNRPAVETEQWLSAYMHGYQFQGNSLPVAVTSQLLGATLDSPAFGNGGTSKRSKRQIYNIGEWTDAMIYLSLFVSKFPEQIQALIKYCTTIREASARFGAKEALA